jgi:putative transposase
MAHQKEIEMRKEAIERFLQGEKPHQIYRDLGRSKPWFFKWLGQYRSQEAEWYQDQSRAPHRVKNKLAVEGEELIVEIRQELMATKYAQVGANAINWALQKRGVSPLPISTINRVVKRRGLLRKKERPASKHRPYVELPGMGPNNIHQADLVGPRFIKKDGRFYSFNVMDVETHRVKLNPLRRKADVAIATALVESWKALGLPEFLQMDNELSFRGSNRYPHSLGLVLRLCLALGVEPVFIPIAEPWRNAEIERFNEVFERSFFRAQTFPSYAALCREAGVFEKYHNQHHVYSCLKGQTPQAALGDEKIACPPEGFKLPDENTPLEDGKIHLIRLIRSDRVLEVFGEKFTVSADLVYEYVVATIITEIHQLQVRHDHQLVHGFDYSIPLQTVCGKRCAETFLA